MAPDPAEDAVDVPGRGGAESLLLPLQKVDGAANGLRSRMSSQRRRGQGLALPARRAARARAAQPLRQAQEQAAKRFERRRRMRQRGVSAGQARASGSDVNAAARDVVDAAGRRRKRRFFPLLEQRRRLRFRNEALRAVLRLLPRGRAGSGRVGEEPAARLHADRRGLLDRGLRRQQVRGLQNDGLRHERRPLPRAPLRPNLRPDSHPLGPTRHAPQARTTPRDDAGDRFGRPPSGPKRVVVVVLARHPRPSSSLGGDTLQRQQPRPPLLCGGDTTLGSSPALQSRPPPSTAGSSSVESRPSFVNDSGRSARKTALPRHTHVASLDALPSSLDHCCPFCLLACCSARVLFISVLAVSHSFPPATSRRRKPLSIRHDEIIPHSQKTPVIAFFAAGPKRNDRF
mmetsp:Transcript_27022/g.82948  ORF Transcript_27022/g.82948 Transcript_27022/m.82948 type:complete len:401 (-) Transcript_27022:261-1463(-)